MYFDAASYPSAEFPLQRLKLPFFCVFMIPLFCALVFILWIESAAGAGAGFRLSISFIRYFNTSAAGLVPGKQKIHRIGKRNLPVLENCFCQKKARSADLPLLFLCFCCRYLLLFLCCITVEKRFSAWHFRIAVLQNGDHNRIISISQIVILRRVYYIVFCHLK